jgi:integrase
MALCRSAGRILESIEQNREPGEDELATGLRQSNVLGLEWSHVNLDTGHAWVGAAQSKSRRPIAVPLNATAVKVLRRQLGKHSERVFTCRGRPISWANTLA